MTNASQRSKSVELHKDRSKGFMEKMTWSCWWREGMRQQHHIKSSDNIYFPFVLLTRSLKECSLYLIKIMSCPLGKILKVTFQSSCSFCIFESTSLYPIKHPLCIFTLWWASITYMILVLARIVWHDAPLLLFKWTNKISIFLFVS